MDIKHRNEMFDTSWLCLAMHCYAGHVLKIEGLFTHLVHVPSYVEVPLLAKVLHHLLQRKYSRVHTVVHTEYRKIRYKNMQMHTLSINSKCEKTLYTFIHYAANAAVINLSFKRFLRCACSTKYELEYVWIKKSRIRTHTDTQTLTHRHTRNCGWESTNNSRLREVISAGVEAEIKPAKKKTKTIQTATKGKASHVEGKMNRFRQPLHRNARKCWRLTSSQILLQVSLQLFPQKPRCRCHKAPPRANALRTIAPTVCKRHRDLKHLHTESTKWRGNKAQSNAKRRNEMKQRNEAKNFKELQLEMKQTKQTVLTNAVAWFSVLSLCQVHVGFQSWPMVPETSGKHSGKVRSLQNHATVCRIRNDDTGWLSMKERKWGELYRVLCGSLCHRAEGPHGLQHQAGQLQSWNGNSPCSSSAAPAATTTTTATTTKKEPVIIVIIIVIIMIIMIIA